MLGDRVDARADGLGVVADDDELEPLDEPDPVDVLGVGVVVAAFADATPASTAPARTPPPRRVAVRAQLRGRRAGVLSVAMVSSIMVISWVRGDRGDRSPSRTTVAAARARAP